MTTKTISFSAICKELYQEEKQARDFHEYYQEQRTRFKELMTSLGIDVEAMKKTEDGTFALPESKKDVVKELLKDYTKAPMKKVRKQKFREMDRGDLNKVVADLEGLLGEGWSGSAQYNQLNGLYMSTRVKIDEAIANLNNTAMNMIQNDVEDLRTIFHKDKTIQRTLNESDRIGLIDYYTMLLANASAQFRAMVDFASEARRAEISELSVEMAEQGIEIANDDLWEHFERELQDIRWIILDAVGEYREDQERVNMSHQEELDKVAKEMEDLKNEYENKGEGR